MLLRPEIVVVGSLNADFVLRTDRFPAPGETVVGSDFSVFAGGKGANQAYAAARLGARVSMIGQVGGDAHADWLKASLISAGVDVSHVGQDPRTTSGVAMIALDTSGQNRIVVVPGANGTFTPERVERSRKVIESARVVLLQLEIPVESVALAARWAKEGGALVILDPAPARPLPAELLENVDYLTPNETELAQLCGDPHEARGREGVLRQARQLQARGCGRVIVKMGRAGAALADREKDHFWPAIPVTAVDTTAAGDAFNAGFACALASNCSEIDASWFAVAAAGCAVTKLGAQSSMPTRAEVDAVLKSQIRDPKETPLETKKGGPEKTGTPGYS